MILTFSEDSVVVDASLLVDAVIDVAGCAGRIVGVELHAPVTIDAEVVQALRRRWMLGQLDDTEARIAIASFRTRHILRHPVQPLVDRMWAIRRNVTAYDASYVALAESLNLPLITRDRRLANSSGHAARIEYID
jgi:predicted nucleic acid-binding protein